MRRLSKITWFVGALLSAAVAGFSYRYVARVGIVPSNIAANRFFNPWIIVHAGGASTALLLGPLQFLTTIRRRWPRTHRWIGRTYVIGCLFGGVSGVILASGVSTGIISATGFGTLAVLWLYMTAQGLRTARAGNFSDHRRWMIRSFALTFAAVTLRIYLPISQVIGIHFTTAYPAIAWLAWVPKAIVAEFYLSRDYRPARTLQVSTEA